MKIFLYFSFSPRKTFKCDKNDRPIKNFGYSSSLNCSINHSRSTLNNEIIIKVSLVLSLFASLKHSQNE